jgi:hypothetical protein
VWGTVSLEGCSVTVTIFMPNIIQILYYIPVYAKNRDYNKSRRKAYQKINKQSEIKKKKK